MLAASPLHHLSQHARTALDNGYIKPTKRVFDNSKVSDHFAIIPTLQAPSGLSEAEQKLYDLVVRRFLAVFFPSAEFMVTTRITKVAVPGLAAAPGRPKPGDTPSGGSAAHEVASVGAQVHHFKTEGKVLVKPGWMAVYGKEAAADVEDAKDGDKGQNLVAVQPNEQVKTLEALPRA